MRHPLKTFSAILCLTAVILLAGYFALCGYYAQADFVCGTWVNGVYCAGRTTEDVERELTERFWEGSILVTDSGGREERVERSVFAPLFSCNYGTQLKLLTAQRERAAFGWLTRVFYPRGYELTPELVPVMSAPNQEAYLADYISCIREARELTQPLVALQKTPEGYCLLDEKKHCLQAGQAVKAVVRAVELGRESVDLEEQGCYTNLAYTEQERGTLSLWDKVSAFQDCSIIYRFGEEEEHVDASVVCAWIKTAEDGSFEQDENGALVADEAKMAAYIDSLAEEYDTYGKARQFQTTGGAVVTIEGGTYGNELDKKAELAYLKEAFAKKAKETHEPAYLRKAWHQGKDDIGGTYIEVDITAQTMYYYVDGQRVIETPIVTGDMMRRRNTPAAVCYVYAKQKNRVLRGPGYASHVNFWMPVKNGIGIHDAKWRSEFGGEIYKTSGSHGCINTPYEAAEELYRLVEIGTPVVMFY